MSLPRYPEYKESGVEWLGEVPARWAVMKIGYGLKESPCYGVLVPDFQITGVPMLRIMDMQSGRVNKDELTTISEKLSEQYSRTITKVGDVLLSVVGTIGEVVHVDASLENINLSRAVARLLVSEKLQQHFLGWVLQSNIFTTYVDLICVGSAQRVLNMSDLSAFQIAIPSIPEQTAIATFLDRETAKIDTLIAEQEKLIALLAEKRQATISHAVTKGLNPDAPMKDSGVEWLGEVPAHWEISHLKRLCSLITDGAHVSPETDGGVFHFVSTKDLLGDGIDFDGSLLTTHASYEYLVKNGCKPQLGDVLFSKDGTIGRTVVVRERKEFVVASSLIIIRPNSALLKSDFLNFLCKSSVVSRQVDGFVKGAGLPRLSIQNLLKVIGVFPPLPEQAVIASFLEAETARFDALTAEATRAITLLKERRTALISAAVTGKIDVRTLA